MCYSDAPNASVLLSGLGFVAEELISRYPNVPYIPFMGCPPKSNGLGQSLWPSVDSLHPSDLLLRVLERGELRVASYGQPPVTPHPAGPDRAFKGFDWSFEANYSEDPPTGMKMARQTQCKHCVVSHVHWHELCAPTTKRVYRVLPRLLASHSSRIGKSLRVESAGQMDFLH